MAGIGKFLGGVVSDAFGPRSVQYYKDGNSSAYDFGQKGEFYLTNLPRQKFKYFLEIQFNNETSSVEGSRDFIKRYFTNNEAKLLIPLAKSVEMPGATIATEKLNQYNHWRISQTKIEYEPITITFHDVVDGKTLRFWEMYYEYYFKDGLSMNRSQGKTGGKGKGRSAAGPTVSRKSSGLTNTTESGNVGSHDVLDSNFNKDFGYNLETINDVKNLIKYISIYNVHAQTYTRVDLVNPRITSFKHDSLSYEDSDLVELSLTFDYEYFLYDNFSNGLSEEIITEIYGNSNPREIDKFKPTKPKDIAFRDRSLQAEVTATSPIEESKDTSLLGNLQGSIDGLIDAAPGMIQDTVSKGIMTGEFKFPIDPKAVKTQLISNLKNQSKASTARTFGALAATATGAFTDVVRKVPKLTDIRDKILPSDPDESSLPEDSNG